MARGLFLALRARGFSHGALAAGLYLLLKRSPNPWVVTPGGSREPRAPPEAALCIPSLSLSFFFFINMFVYLFIFGCVGSSLL